MSLILVAQHLLAQPHKGLLVHLLGDVAALHLLELEFVVCHRPQCLLAANPVDEPIALQVEQGEYVGDLLLGEDAGFEALLLLQLEPLDQKLFDVLGLLEAEVAAQVLHQLDDAVLSEVLVSLLFEYVGVGCSHLGSYIKANNKRRNSLLV